MDFRDRLMEALRIAGKTRAQLADELDISPAAISHWTLGKVSTLRGETAARLEAATGVRSLWLLTGEGPKLVSEDIGQPFNGHTSVPCLSPQVVQNWLENPDPYQNGYQPKWLSTSQPVSRLSFALTIDDDSMRPDLERGDQVIADPEIKPVPGRLVVAQAEGLGPMIRKYRPRRVRSTGESFDLVPSNEDYPTISNEDVPVVVIATILEHRRYLVSSR